VEADMDGTYFANRAVEYIGEDHKGPFFLMVSFYEPHSPFHFPIEYRGRHRPEDFSVPQPGPEDDWQIPQVFRGLTDREKQGIIAAYYTSVEFLDRNVGRVLAALEKSGQAQNTIVIFLGDNGYLLGQHGRFEKHCGYEEAIRCPLLIRYPPLVKPRQSTTALVEFLDLFPTVSEFAGVTAPGNVQGQSLQRLLTGKTRRHREQVFIEYSENEEGYLRTDRWKFIYGTGKRTRKDGYATGHPTSAPMIQLYDLKKDPAEMTNVAAHPANARLVAGFTAQLAAHFKRTARQPELIPQTDDPRAILEFSLQPRDLPLAPKKAPAHEQ
jgi:choline-sulfatase